MAPAQCPGHCSVSGEELNGIKVSRTAVDVVGDRQQDQCQHQHLFWRASANIDANANQGVPGNSGSSTSSRTSAGLEQQPVLSCFCAVRQHTYNMYVPKLPTQCDRGAIPREILRPRCQPQPMESQEPSAAQLMCQSAAVVACLQNLGSRVHMFA